MSRMFGRNSVDRLLTRSLSSSVFTWREIFKLMIPGILDNLSITLISMLTTALISKNGETSIAAVSLVGPVTGLMVCFFTGISAGASVMVAQCWGGQNEDRLKRGIATGVNSPQWRRSSEAESHIFA